MIYILLLLAFVGILISKVLVKGSGNPFQIYFGVWFSIFVIYALTKDSWIQLPFNVYLMLIVNIVIWMLGLLIYTNLLSDHKITNYFDQRNRLRFNARLLNLLILASLAASPFVLMTALKLAGGESLLTVEGYTALRRSLVSGSGYGVLAYFVPLSFVLSSIVLFRIFRREATLFEILTAIPLSIFYAYTATGRGFFLMLAVMTVSPLVIYRYLRVSGLILVALIFLSLFILISYLTSKGIQQGVSVSGNYTSFVLSLRSYTVAPLLAFGVMIDNINTYSYGAHVFRIIYAAMNAIGFDYNIVPLVKGYVRVPDLTNVYTVYDPYFRDFGVIGVHVFTLIIMSFHLVLYRFFLIKGGWVAFYYGATLFPLIMQFFQDMYFSLMSMWIQICIWYYILVKTSPKFGGEKRQIKLRHK